MKTAGVLILMMATALIVAKTTISFKKYVNIRFGYQISYPHFLNPQPESINGDGREFVSQSKNLKVIVWGDNNVFDQTSKERFEELVMELKEGRKTIISKTYNSNNYFVTWDANGKRYFQRSVSGQGRWSNVIIEFPSSQISEFGKVSEQVALSLSAPKRG